MIIETKIKNSDFNIESIVQKTAEIEKDDKIKGFTSLEQSMVLDEILPIESADMCYRIVAYNPDDTHVYRPYCFVGTLESDIPCWSLAALLNYLREIDFFPNIEANAHGVIMNINYYDEEETKPLAPVHNIKVEADTFVNACYEMVLKLNELKML